VGKRKVVFIFIVVFLERPSRGVTPFPVNTFHDTGLKGTVRETRGAFTLYLVNNSSYSYLILKSDKKAKKYFKTKGNTQTKLNHLLQVFKLQHIDNNNIDIWKRRKWI